MGTELDNMELEAGDRLECTAGFSFFTTGAIYQIDENLWITDDDGVAWGPNSFLGDYPVAPKFKLLGPVQALTTRSDLDVDIEFENSRLIVNEDRPRLIGLAGRAGSGKSLAADTLIGGGYVRVKMADILKDMLRALYANIGLDDVQIEDRIEGHLKEVECEYLGQTPRHAMQTLGTEWGRGLIDENLWVTLWSLKVMTLLTDGHDVVVDDVRFANEVNAIRAMGGFVYRVEREVPAREVSTHGSERYAFEPDAVIVNGGTKADLVHQIRSIFL